jgi:hypothetical protein
MEPGCSTLSPLRTTTQGEKFLSDIGIEVRDRILGAGWVPLFIFIFDLYLYL